MTVLYVVIEALVEGGVKVGLPRAVATELAARTSWSTANNLSLDSLTGLEADATLAPPLLVRDTPPPARTSQES